MEDFDWLLQMCISVDSHEYFLGRFFTEHPDLLTDASVVASVIDRIGCDDPQGYLKQCIEELENYN